MPDDYKVFLKFIGRKQGRVIDLRRNWKMELENYKDPRILVSIDFPTIYHTFKQWYKHNLLGWFYDEKEYGEKEHNFFLFG